MLMRAGMHARTRDEPARHAAAPFKMQQESVAQQSKRISKTPGQRQVLHVALSTTILHHQILHTLETVLWWGAEND